MDNDFSDRATDGDVNGDDIARSHGSDRASAGKIFIGGLSRDTTNGYHHVHYGYHQYHIRSYHCGLHQAEFVKYFSKYGELTDSVIMKDRKTGHPRGFGFVTYADPSVVDQVIEAVHVINGKQVEIKRTIPKSSPNSKDFKTKRLFVGGIPTTVTEQELKDFFSNFGEVKEHQILRDHETNRSRGFGFITFDSSDDVDNLLSKGNHIDMADTQVEIKKAEPKNSSLPPPSRRGSRSAYGDMFDDGYGAGYVSYYRSGGHGSRMGGGGYRGGADFGYGGYGGMDGYRGESSLGFPRRYGGNSFGGGGYGGYGDGGMAGGGAGYGSGYGAPGMDGGFGAGGAAGAYYGNRGGGGGGGGTYGNRYHPYGR